MQTLITSREIPLAIESAKKEKKRLQFLLDAEEESQAKIELGLWKKPKCHEDTLDYLRDHIGTFNTEELLRYLREKFYNRDVMRAIRCTMESIFTPVDDGGLQDNERIRYWIEPVERIGADSAFGYAIRSNVGDQGEDVLVLKAPRMEDVESLVHEYIVGVYGTNLLRGIVPNFAYVFGTFDCTAPVLFQSGKVSTWCNEEVNSIGYVSYENITPSVTLGKYVETCTFGEFLNMYLQIMYALRKAHQLVDFTHYDLHSQNVLVRDISGIFPDGCVIPYETESGTQYLFANKIATMIDFGQAHIKIEGKSFGYYGIEQYGNVASQSFLLFDAYKLLLMSMRNMLQAGNKNCFDGAARILRFFNSSEDPVSIIREQARYLYVLPRTKKILGVQFDTFLRYLRQTFAPAFVTQNIPRNKILICKEEECKTETKVLTQLGFANQVNAKNILEFYDLFDRFINNNNFQDAETIKKNFDYKQQANIASTDLRNGILALASVVRSFDVYDISQIPYSDRDRKIFLAMLRSNASSNQILDALALLDQAYRRANERQIFSIVTKLNDAEIDRLVYLLNQLGVKIQVPLTIRSPEVLSNHRRNFDTFASYVDIYQDLSVLNRALTFTANTFDDRKTQAESRQLGQDLQVIAGQLRTIWNQYQQQTQIFASIKDLRSYNKEFKQVLTTLSAVIS